MTEAQRICSLLPSATEIVYALGLGDRLVGVTHECDYPEDARSRPHVTASVINGEELSAREIDDAVRRSLRDSATIYLLDSEVMEKLRPDLILTQELCTVCAVGANEVRSVVTQLPGNPKVVSLEPRTFQEVLDSILTVGRLTGTMRRAIGLVDDLRERVEAVHMAVANRPRVRVLTMEWVDPVFVGGHWVPQMVELAGGVDVLGRAGEPSTQVTWAQVAESNPDVIIVMPCGFGLERSEQELRRAELPEEWSRLAAVREGRVWIVDGSSYFNRPGPRLVEGVEILASILHPESGVSAPRDAYKTFVDNRHVDQ